MGGLRAMLGGAGQPAAMRAARAKPAPGRVRALAVRAAGQQAATSAVLLSSRPCVLRPAPWLGLRTERGRQRAAPIITRANHHMPFCSPKEDGPDPPWGVGGTLDRGRAPWGSKRACGDLRA